MDEVAIHLSYSNVEMEYLQRKASISERTMNGSFDLCRRHTLLILGDLQKI